MTLTNDQVHEILSIIDRQIAFYVGQTLGDQYLTENQKELLSKNGIDVGSLYKVSNDTVSLNFHLGMLSDIIGSNAIQNLTFDQLKHYIVSGQHIPLTQQEKEVINSVKHQSLADIKSIQGKIFQDVNNTVANEGNKLRAQQEFIREHIIIGLQKRESVKKISLNLAKLTGDWTRNFTKSVSYISHQALNEGRLAMIQRRYEGGDGQIYFIVQNSACEKCVKAYLTNGHGSQPKIFTIKELLHNGSNIGRKSNEWLPVIGPMHPSCRCAISEYHQGEQWNGHRFVAPSQGYQPTIKRNKVRIQFNGAEYFV